MAFLKKYLEMILFAVACLAAGGAAGWGYVAGGDIIERMQGVEKLRTDLRRQRSDPANLATIAARKKRIAQENAELDRTLNEALATQRMNAFDGQPRSLLVPDVLPKPKSPGDALNFKTAYQRAFKELFERMRGRDHATRREIAAQQAIIDSKDRSADSGPRGPWIPEAPTGDEASEEDAKDRTLAEVLSESAEARAAEVVARSIYMYIDKNAMRPHPLIKTDKVPDEIQIWHAQMSLWIQQDIATALSRVNEQRAAELAAAGRESDAWVAHMPIKRLQVFRIKGWLGRGGGSNEGRFARSFVGQENDKSKFLVPLQMDLVVEEASLMNVLESLCAVGFYVPTQMTYRQVELDPLQQKYIYGEDPVLLVTIDLEAYYLRKVFEDWIPKPLKKILATPEAQEETKGRR